MPKDELVEAVARALAVQDGYDPDETWQEFNRNAAAADMMCGNVPDEEIFPTFVRWREYESAAQAAIAAARPVIVEDAMIALKDELTACYSGEGVYVLSSLIDLQIERAAAIRAIARGGEG